MSPPPNVGPPRKSAVRKRVGSTGASAQSSRPARGDGHGQRIDIDSAESADDLCRRRMRRQQLGGRQQERTTTHRWIAHGHLDRVVILERQSSNGGSNRGIGVMNAVSSPRRRSDERFADHARQPRPQLLQDVLVDIGGQHGGLGLDHLSVTDQNRGRPPRPGDERHDRGDGPFRAGSGGRRERSDLPTGHRDQAPVGSQAARSLSRASLENISPIGMIWLIRFWRRLISSSSSHIDRVTTNPDSPARAVRPAR